MPLPDPTDKEKLRGRCDSFVVETNVEYPTDTRLLFDALRKVIELLVRLCRRHQVEESIGLGAIKRLKKLWRRLQKLKPSTSPDESKQASRRKDIVEAYQAYLDCARELVECAERKLAELEKKDGTNKDKILKIKEFMNHTRRQIDQTDRRVIQGQTREPLQFDMEAERCFTAVKQCAGHCRACWLPHSPSCWQVLYITPTIGQCIGSPAS